MSPRLQIAAIAEATAAEGPHERFAVWVQGCAIRCPGCCNPEMFDPRGGSAIEVNALLDRIAIARREHGVEGLTLLGGEPFEQAPAVAALAHGARRLGLGVIAFSGLRLVRARAVPGFAALWRALDTLVDGPYLAARPEAPGGRRFVGSGNQRILHRTLRYADPALWRGPALSQIEIGTDGRLTLTGFPDPVERLVSAADVVRPQRWPNPRRSSG